MFEALISVVALVAIAALIWRGRGRPRRLGSAAVGSVYDMLNEDKRKAVEIVVEGRAEARDPEHADGNLPDLEDPHRTR
jgi:fructose-1,6-bisphosphatase/sedoheptulose 1,7-bisphosphatase-like protein